MVVGRLAYKRWGRGGGGWRSHLSPGPQAQVISRVTHGQQVVRAVPSTCPNCRQLAVNHGLRQRLPRARAPGPPPSIRRIKLVPKLTVRVRFPSPAPCANAVAAKSNSRFPVLCEPVFSVHARATMGHYGPLWATRSHLGTHLSVSKGRSAFRITAPALAKRPSYWSAPTCGRTGPRRVRHRSHCATDTCRLATGSGATARSRPDDRAQCGMNARSRK